jgi:PD-(D/E)XK nuclease superfamily
VVWSGRLPTPFYHGGDAHAAGGWTLVLLNGSTSEGPAPALDHHQDLRLRLDVVTKTKQPELHRYWTQRDRAATRRLFRLAAEVLRAIEAEAFHPIPGWHCQDCPFRSRCWAWG